MSIDFAFLDSGTGGIPYMQFLKKRYPNEKCVYLADTKNFPYGERSPESIIECSAESVKMIVSRFNPRALIIACNTISVTALDELRKRNPDIPIVGTVPAIKLAASVTKNKNIGLLATRATVNNAYVNQLAVDFASDCNVVLRGDGELVSFIEHNYFTATNEERLAAVKPAVDFFASKNCDTIILGCTHFIHLAKEIAQVAGSSVNVVDSRDGVIRQAVKVELAKKEKSVEPDAALPVSDSTLFVTGFKSLSDEKEYSVLCKNLGIPWGGILK